jgi:hypothetical protein
MRERTPPNQPRKKVVKPSNNKNASLTAGLGDAGDGARDGELIVGRGGRDPARGRGWLSVGEDDTPAACKEGKLAHNPKAQPFKRCIKCRPMAKVGNLTKP